jgi:TonB family C-terminal domain
MRSPIYLGLFLLLCVTNTICFAWDDSPNDTLKRAQNLSSLTGPHAQPFHLKLTIAEPSNPNSPYHATIEEFWQSPKLWQRSITSASFHQNISMSNGTLSEQNNGYYPLWIRGFVTAAIDPLDDIAFWNQVSARIVLTTTSGAASTSCARAQFKIGTLSVNNDAFAAICFNSDGTLSSVVRPGYDMEFHDIKAFGKKRIAHTYIDDPEPGTKLVGIIESLEALQPGSPLPSLPVIENPSSTPNKSGRVSQDTFEQLSDHPTLMWPPVHSGNTSGKLSMYVSVDQEGHIREAYPLNSDNAGLQVPARDQLLKWKLKPAVSNGTPIQVEAALTFQFSTSLDGTPGVPAVSTDSSQGTIPPAPVSKPIIVSPAIAHSLQTKSFAPVYPQKLKEMRISGKVEFDAVIGKEGQIVSLTPKYSTDPDFTKAAIAAVQHWAYKPYLLNGTPVEIQTVLTVNFNAQ